MLRVEQGALRFLQFNCFDARTVAHAIFTRHGGVSPEPYASLNMSVSTGDAGENVRANVTAAFRALERDPATCADLWQVHSARVVADEDCHVVVYVHGEIDAATAPRLHDLLTSALAADVVGIRVDLHDVPFMDSTGVGVLIEVMVALEAAGGTFQVSRPQPAPLRVIDICGLSERFHLSDLDAND